jgi:hypothetical protein
MLRKIGATSEAGRFPLATSGSGQRLKEKLGAPTAGYGAQITGEILMADKIIRGTILIKEGTLLPENVKLESVPYLNGWRLAQGLASQELDRRLCEARWNLFYMAEEVKVVVVGLDLEKMTRRAGGRIVASTKLDRFNCLEIADVAAKRFLGGLFVTVSAHPRHIQESTVLFHAKRLAEWDHAKLAAA